MPINKIDRKELKEMLVTILSKSATFKMLSNDDEINPCRISFDGMEFYIYIKNLSPAQLSNDNPDIWRIQLPIREDFNSLKDVDIPFIALGYDDENKVFTTWNPYWVKQRLNAAKSVSLYSRLTLQKSVSLTQLFQRQELNNESVVIAFPCSKLGYYLVNIKQFFPEMTEYVAMGSRKRSEANSAYHCLCDIKNISQYAHYLTLQKYASGTINNYCCAIKKLISQGYFSRNRKIFLSCDSLSEYPNVINNFIAVPEVYELNETTHHQISNGLRSYIQCLLKINNMNDDIEDVPEDVPESNVNSTSEPEEEPAETDKNIDWEAMFTDSNGKLTRIANPQLIDLLRPMLNTEYRKLSAAYKIITDFYGNKYNTTMQLKDWNNLFNQINWQSPYYAPTAKTLQKHKSHILKVTAPNGCVFQEKRVSETLVQVIKYAGVEDVRNMNINVCAANMIITEDEINPRYAAATKYIEKNLYANTWSDTPTKASIIKRISDALQLGLTIEFIAIDGSNSEPQQSIANVATSSRKKIKITFIDGEEICYNNVSETFVKAIKKIGAENVRDLNYTMAGDNIIITKEQINPKYRASTKQIDDKWYCFTNISTEKKAEILKGISEKLQLNLSIELL